MSSQHAAVLEQFLEQHPDTQYLDAYICDLSCIFRGKRYPIDEAEKLFTEGMMLPGSTFMLTVNGDSQAPECLGYSDGDPDEVAIPIARTLAPCPWAELPTAQVMLTLQGLDGTCYDYEPRNVLKRVLDRFKTLGLRPVVAFEPEFYLLESAQNSQTGPVPAHLPSTGAQPTATQVYSLDEIEEFSIYFDRVVSICRQQGIRISAISKEYSPSQFELNLHHVEDAVKAADDYVILRRTIEGVARRCGLRASFMAKPFPEQSGSGLHIHVSLLDEMGNNVFSADGEFGKPDSISDIMRFSLGGLRQTMAEAIGLFAPNANSYRRFKPDEYVPIRDDWGFENRCVALRIPKSNADARRIEHRVAGADANPYLMLAAMLAGIHHGIRQKIDPGPPMIGNRPTKRSNPIPSDLNKAMSMVRESRFLAEYLGRQYTKMYTACKLEEYGKFQSCAADEFAWYG